MNGAMKVVLASGNAGKLRELAALLAGLNIELISQSNLNVTPAAETGQTFIENALIKARHASRQTALPAIADDSGLVVRALGGKPGVRSARYAGEAATDADNNRKLIGTLADASDRSAWFYCALVFLQHPQDPSPLLATGQWRGQIIDEPKGANGFGYDPHFLIPHLNKTSAELPPQQKNQLSHRGQAANALVAALAQSNAVR